MLNKTCPAVGQLHVEDWEKEIRDTNNLITIIKIRETNAENTNTGNKMLLTFISTRKYACKCVSNL